MSGFLSGVLACGFWVAGLFFWRFWRSSRDRLFLFFACAFWLMCVERFVLIEWRAALELNPLVYVLRVVAFLLIIVGIVEKNRKQ